MVESVADGELVRSIALRERLHEAEAELCRRFAPRVRLYGLRHLKTEDHAADLVQSVLLAVLEAARAGRIAEPEHVERFVLGTCRNVAQRVREREARAVPVEAAELDILAYLPDFERIGAAALGQCMSKLDARSRTVVVLSFQAEQSAEEIATVTQISAGNVRVVRHRALAQLRRCLDGSEGAGP
jgi:RNA polymerase sigma-70 factor, ECF subfamily